ncbi:MAG: histidine phosphatase family protein [Solirubrobacterales bacterium]
MVRKIYLMRHAAVIKPKEKIFVGSKDLMLSARGIFQAKRISDYFSEIPLEGVFCSSLKRASATAEIICRGRKVPINIVKELNEINVGSFEGKSIKEVAEQYPLEILQRDTDIYNYKFPGGESYFELESRVYGAFCRIIENTTGDILIVAHEGVNRAILSKIIECSGSNLKKNISFDLKCGGINVIKQYNKGYSVSKNILIA